MKQISNYRVHLPIPVRVTIDYENLQRVQYLVGKCAVECQWFHRVTKTVDESGITYALTELFVPEQWVQAAQVEADPMMLVSYWQELRKERELSLRELSPIIQETTCWCHSHVNMGPGPSGQDTKQFKENIELALKDENENPQIMLITNKKSDVFLKVFDPELNLVFESPKLVILGELSYPDLDEIVKTKLKTKPVAPVKTVSRPAAYPHWTQQTTPRSAGPKPSTVIDWNDDANTLGKPQGGATTKTETEELSFDDIDRDHKMMALVDHINDNTECGPACEKLINMIERHIDGNEWSTVELLLFGDRPQLIEYARSPWIDDDVDAAKLAFMDTLEGEIIHPPYRLSKALGIIKQIRGVTDAARLTTILRSWAQEML